MTKYLKLK